MLCCKEKDTLLCQSDPAPAILLKILDLYGKNILDSSQIKDYRLVSIGTAFEISKKFPIASSEYPDDGSKVFYCNDVLFESLGKSKEFAILFKTDTIVKMNFKLEERTSSNGCTFNLTTFAQFNGKVYPEPNTYFYIVQLEKEF